MPLLEKIYALERSGSVDIQPFFYSTQFTSSSAAGVVTLGTTVTQNIGIQSDSHFVVRYLNTTCYDSPQIIVRTALAALTISLFDTGSGRTIFDNPQAVQNVTGGTPGTQGGSGGSAPFIFPEPWLIRAGSQIQVSITNLGQITFPRLDVSLCGFKVFQFGTNQPANL
jgi:hypothetical protein